MAARSRDTCFCGGQPTRDLFFFPYKYAETKEPYAFCAEHYAEHVLDDLDQHFYDQHDAFEDKIVDGLVKIIAEYGSVI